jgi:endonuclease VIII
MTADFTVPCFSAPIVELLTARGLARREDLAALGPHVITPEFHPVIARQRLRRRPELEISVALMDQTVMTGVGNEFKSEILFIRRVSPFVKIQDLDDATLDGLIAESHRLLTLNRERGRRRTVFRLNERERLWVYGRVGQPCRICGSTVCLWKQGLEARLTYYCPECQSVRGAPRDWIDPPETGGEVHNGFDTFADDLDG